MDTVPEGAFEAVGKLDAAAEVGLGGTLGPRVAGAVGSIFSFLLHNVFVTFQNVLRSLFFSELRFPISFLV